MAKSRLVKILLALPFVALAAVLLWKLTAPPVPVGWQEYSIKSGDTLWGIASAYGDDYDPRHIIYDIKEKNDCDANIAAGDVILVPEY